MVRTSLNIAVLALATIMMWPGRSSTIERTHVLALEHAELRLTPAALVFDKKGDLYTGYRDKGFKKKSVAIWIRVFDPVSGNELRSAQYQTAAVPLPNGAEQFLLSPDNSLLLYSQFHGIILIMAVNSGTLQEVSRTTSLPGDVSNHFPVVNSISLDGNSILIEAGITNRLNGNDVQLVRLSAHDLTRTLSDVTFANPIPESGFSVDRDGTMWITRANDIYRYDWTGGRAVVALSVQNHDDIRSAFPLSDGFRLAWSGQNEFGYLYRFKEGSSQPQQSQRIDGYGVERVVLSPDKQYGVALCEHQSDREWNFGAITARAAVIFETKTLKILAQLPIEKRLYPELAIWHGDGKIVLATQASPDKLAIYELAVH